MSKLILVMSMGWDVNIECKGVGREFAMTFEASANHGFGGEMVHSVGDTLDETLNVLCGKILEYHYSQKQGGKNNDRRTIN